MHHAYTYITFLEITYALLSSTIDINILKHKLEIKAVQSTDANKALEFGCTQGNIPLELINRQGIFAEQKKTLSRNHSSSAVTLAGCIKETFFQFLHVVHVNEILILIVVLLFHPIES